MDVGMTEISSAIGLSSDWPREVTDDDEITVAGLFEWTEAHFAAAEELYLSPQNDRLTPFYFGPVTQAVGLATELTLKTLLRGMGASAKEARRHSHNTYSSYLAARDCFDEAKFINLSLANTQHLAVPAEVQERLSAQGEVDIETRWRVYFDHLRLLDGIYDRPFRSRYVTPGHGAWPEAEIILSGTKILLIAMRERLDTQQAISP